MYSYLLQTSGTAQGERLFSTKAVAIKAFNRAFCFGGSVTLHQGSFSQHPEFGFARQHGLAFELARGQFDEEGNAC